MRPRDKSGFSIALPPTPPKAPTPFPSLDVVNQLLYFVTRLFDDGFVEESFTPTYLCEWESWALLYHLGS
jgi:hypothetical protein